MGEVITPSANTMEAYSGYVPKPQKKTTNRGET